MPSPLKIFSHPDLANSHQPDHPESPQRFKLIHQSLKELNFCSFHQSKPAKEADILRVHTKKHLNAVKHNTFTNADTPNLENLYHFASLAAGTVIQAAQAAARNNPTFALIRPPGHHAGKESIEGFCYFNNLAIACYKRLEKGSAQKIAILDLDVHHGNGTQNIVLGKNNIQFHSLHQHPLYPGSGLKNKENCYNYPLAPETKWPRYQKALNKALDRIRKFQPSLLAISIGFDTHHTDPLANLHLKTTDYKKMGHQLNQLNLPACFTLEGGYSAKIGECAKQLFEGFCHVHPH